MSALNESRANLNAKGIYPYFYKEFIQKDTAADINTFTHNGNDFFVIGTLYSKKILGRDNYLSKALEILIKLFKEQNGNILENMKSAIFGSGDQIAQILIDKGEDVEDVDYSVAFLTIVDGVLYVWIDGSLNLRIYRGKESLLVNSAGEPSFYGSTTVELGDVISVGFTNDLKNYDAKFEDYVLEKTKPKYLGFFLDYQADAKENDDKMLGIGQVEPNTLPDDSKMKTSEEKVEYLDDKRVDLPENFQPLDLDNRKNEVTEENNIGVKSNEDIDISEVDNRLADKSELPDEPVNLRRPVAEHGSKATISDRLKPVIANIAKGFQNFKESGVLQKIVDRIKKAGIFIWNMLMAFSGFLLDSIYGLIYRGSPHQIKRFQGSVKKRNLQFLLVGVICLLIVYLIGSFAFSFGGKDNGNTTNILTNNTNSNTKQKIESTFTNMVNAANSQNYTDFDNYYTELTAQINTAKNTGFTDENDPNYLANKLTLANDRRNILYQIYPVTKPSAYYAPAQTIQNPGIVDFSAIGDDVYALDRNNSSILKSNQTTSTLEVLATDAQYTALSKISCVDSSCYLVDENLGILIFDISSRKFSKFTDLKNAGRNVSELETYKVGNSVFVYTMVPSEGKILRYARSGPGFSKTIDIWNQSSGFGNGIVDFAIDGSIYEMSNLGDLRKFFNRKLVAATEFAGLQSPNISFGTNLQIAVTTDSTPERFFVADSSNERIAVYDKSLDSNLKFQFKGSYKYTGTDLIRFNNIKQLEVSDNGKSLFILNDNLIVKISATDL